MQYVVAVSFTYTYVCLCVNYVHKLCFYFLLYHRDDVSKDTTAVIVVQQS